MGSTSSRKAEVTRRVKDKEVHFTESSDSDTSETETDLWSNLPPFPDTSNENGRTRYRDTPIVETNYGVQLYSAQ